MLKIAVITRYFPSSGEPWQESPGLRSPERNVKAISIDWTQSCGRVAGELLGVFNSVVELWGATA